MGALTVVRTDTPERVVRDPVRLRILREVDLLDTPAEESFDRLTRLASRVLHAPVSLVSFVDADRQFFKSGVGLDEPWASARETPLSHSFCQYVVASRRPLVVDDAREDAVLHDNLAVRDLGVVAYAGIPLVTRRSNHALGSFCVVDTRPREWTQEEVAILTDLAASVTTEIELRVAIREAQAANRAKSEFLATMSHELRTPLNAVIGFGELLRDGLIEDEAERHQALTDISDSAAHLLALINDILDLAKIEAGRMVLDAKTVDMPSALAATATLLRERAHTRAITMTVDAGDVQTCVADERKLKQILFNLATNAVKFTPPGGRVHIAARRRGDAVELSVADTGIGISAADQKRLFQEFVQVDSSLARRHEGTGLGLALTKRLVELHGGTIHVRSAPGEGTTFTVRLPQPPS